MILFQKHAVLTPVELHIAPAVMSLLHRANSAQNAVAVDSIFAERRSCSTHSHAADQLQKRPGFAMQHALRRVCSLQAHYSPRKIPAMQERGHLVKNVLPLKIKEQQTKYSRGFNGIDATLEIEAFDGNGRSEECPWIRIFPSTMSPTPKNGFYVVIHFAADGSALFVSICCGSTYRKGRTWKTVSEDKLTIRTSWARNIITERFGSFSPFHDDIDLRSNAARPQLYEKSTVVAKRIALEGIDEDDFINVIASAVEFLAEVCHCYRVGRHLDAGDAAQIEVESILSPRPKANRRKSFGLVRAERHAVHLRALAVALEWLESRDYAVRESCSAPYDFVAEKDGEEIKVEVKGTTSDGARSVVFTRDSVEFHRAHKGASALITVSSIRLDTTVSPPIASRGNVDAFFGLDVDSWKLEPLAYRARITA